jgi:hypothetical protein
MQGAEGEAALILVLNEDEECRSHCEPFAMKQMCNERQASYPAGKNDYRQSAPLISSEQKDKPSCTNTREG